MMYRSAILLLVILTTTSTVESYADLTRVVLLCEELSRRFHSNEDSYVLKTPSDPFVDPDFAGEEISELQNSVFIKEAAQRPFECITNNVPWYLYDYLQLNQAYRKLVFRCQHVSPAPRCGVQSHKFRSIDGTCNNLMNPRWGSSLYRTSRLIPANYNGASGSRQSVCKKLLPDPRSCSISTFKDKNYPTQEITNMFPFFGQALAHDLSDISTSFVGDKTIDCCPAKPKQLHPQCAPILLRNNDPFYAKVNVSCMNVVRAAMFDSCQVGKRDQMNQATSYIDLSFIYDLKDNRSSNLRTKDGTGQMKSQTRNNEYLLPADNTSDICDKERKYYCFLTGDRRGNMHTGIMSLHTLFLREHNRLAKELRKLNPGWKEERLFQEARKINIAQFQVIVYKEFLPLLLGREVTSYYGLWIGNTNSFYNPLIDASLLIEFSAAAFRLHTLLNSIVSPEEVENGIKRIRDIFGNAEPIYHGKMSSLLQGLCQTTSQKYDTYITKDVTNYLYKTFQSEWGFDIASANILRGRDVGLPTYLEVKHFLSKGQIDIKSFDDLRIFMDEKNILNLKNIYCDARDIDLWVGMSNERVSGDMIVGPTAGEIIGLQFKNLKSGDRFYFEHANMFSFGQLQNLKKVTLSNILCLNTDIRRIKINAFKPSDSIKNPETDCKLLPKLDINQWHDNSFSAGAN